MPPLSNARHERFAQELAKGKTLAEAFVEADFEPVKAKKPKGFYVYALVDHLDGKCFYIGKGKKDRVHSHLVEAYSDNPSNTVKSARIVAAHQRSQYEAVVIADGMKETDALKLEKKLIFAANHYLTNKSLGSRSKAEIIRDEVKLGLTQLKPLCVVVKTMPHMTKAYCDIVSELAHVYDLSEKFEVYA
jgi:hypothetical protein